MGRIRLGSVAKGEKDADWATYILRGTALVGAMPSRRPCLDTSPCACNPAGGYHLSSPGQSRCPHHQGWPDRPGMGSGWHQTRARKLQANPRCEVCGRKATTVDHILARAFGGTDAWSNLASLCPTHAARKDHLDREEGKRRAKV